MDVEFKSLKRNKRRLGENVTMLYENIKTEGNWKLVGDADKILGEMVEYIQRSAKQTL